GNLVATDLVNRGRPCYGDGREQGSGSLASQLPITNPPTLFPSLSSQLLPISVLASLLASPAIHLSRGFTMSPPTPLAIVFGLDADKDRPSRWLWHGLLGSGKLTLLTSLWKSGKTTLLAHLLARRRHGGDFLGLAVVPGVSLIVSEEARDLWLE